MAAVIAGAVAFLASVFTKESKTSEFRQAWIDGLRNDISHFIGAYYWVSDVASERPEELATLKDEFIKLEHMQARIELRLNDKKEHEEILCQLHGLVRFETFSVQDSVARTAAVNNFVAESRRILKGEWTRVKRGELTYRITKWISLLAFLAFAIIAVLLVRGHVLISYVP